LDIVSIPDRQPAFIASDDFRLKVEKSEPEETGMPRRSAGTEEE
jgi:hypothetical protein